MIKRKKFWCEEHVSKSVSSSNGRYIASFFCAMFNNQIIIFLVFETFFQRPKKIRQKSDMVCENFLRLLRFEEKNIPDTCSLYQKACFGLTSRTRVAIPYVSNCYFDSNYTMARVMCLTQASQLASKLHNLTNDVSLKASRSVVIVLRGVILNWIWRPL